MFEMVLAETVRWGFWGRGPQKRSAHANACVAAALFDADHMIIGQRQ